MARTYPTPTSAIPKGKGVDISGAWIMSATSSSIGSTLSVGGLNMLIPIRDAMHRLQVDRETLRRWDASGKLRAHRDVRTWRYYQDSEVNRLARRREAAARDLGARP